MRKIIAIEFISQDGVIQSPGSDREDREGGFSKGGWIASFSDPLLSSIIQEEMHDPCSFLLGRKTYDIWAPYWPLNDAIWPEVNKATKYVVSHTPVANAWESSVFIGGNVAEKIAVLKQEPGLPLHLYGSSQVVRLLHAHGLLDELWLKHYPVCLGEGKTLFADSAIPACYQLVEKQRTSSGVVVAYYKNSGQ